ncbi:hypothetical protein [Streptomyces vilmorinianum]|uniref:hypothetical protein n=1 Tax=Streptomyces vilmorinianum TaxID=3051092 RepID=UPI0010FB49A1|nr:hypothetical protein [Streptomyces vilmorinianum]
MSCSISVDDWLVVDFQVDNVDKIYDPMADSESFRFTHRAKMEDLPFSGLGALGDRTAMVSTNCAGPKAHYLVTVVRLSAHVDGDVDKRCKDIEAFTLDFVPKRRRFSAARHDTEKNPLLPRPGVVRPGAAPRR